MTINSDFLMAAHGLIMTRANQMIKATPQLNLEAAYQQAVRDLLQEQPNPLAPADNAEMLVLAIREELSRRMTATTNSGKRYRKRRHKSKIAVSQDLSPTSENKVRTPEKSKSMIILSEDLPDPLYLELLANLSTLVIGKRRRIVLRDHATWVLAWEILPAVIKELGWKPPKPHVRPYLLASDMQTEIVIERKG